MNVATIAGLLRASSAAGLQDFLQRQHGVQAAEANPVSQTVTVRYDDAALTPDVVRALIEGFGCTCGGEIVPCHLCRGVLAGPSLVAWLADRAPFPKRDLEATSLRLRGYWRVGASALGPTTERDRKDGRERDRISATL